jgi:DNA invertase Pin-like site-specific DNA recombinase
MKSRAVDQQRSEKRARVLRMGEDEVPVTEIAKILSVPRNTVVNWLEAAGIEPKMLRKQQTARTGSGLAAGSKLAIEENVKRRVAEMGDG